MHNSSRVPGIPVAKIPQHRVWLDKCQLDHFLEFTSRPYYYQDVAHRGRKFRLESGEELVMPKIVRTVARSWSSGSLPKKILRGLDNTAANGVDGFEALHKILDELEEEGANMEWWRTRSGVCKRAQGWKRLSLTWRRLVEITAKRKTSVPTTILYSPWAIPLMLIIAQIVATTIICRVKTVRH